MLAYHTHPLHPIYQAHLATTWLTHTHLDTICQSHLAATHLTRTHTLRTLTPFVNRAWSQRPLRACTHVASGHLLPIALGLGAQSPHAPGHLRALSWAPFIKHTWPSTHFVSRVAKRFATRFATRFANRFGKSSSRQTCRHQLLAIDLLLCLEDTGAR